MHAQLPREYSQGSLVYPVNSIQKQQLAFNGSVDQRGRPPCCVPIWKSVPLLEKIPGCHVLQMNIDEIKRSTNSNIQMDLLYYNVSIDFPLKIGHK